MNGVFDRIFSFIAIFWEYARNIVDIVFVSFLFYWGYRFLSRTRAVQLIKGIILILFMALVSNFLRLDTLDWIITNVTSYVVLTVVILFQPELRRLITQFGQRNWFSSESEEDVFSLDELVNSVISMSEEKIGSLIVIERNTALKVYVESGVTVDSIVTEEMIRTIFFPLTPLHDGAIIIQNNRISSAASYLPLSDSKFVKKQHGARHRAALGIAEETDALAVLTSEETGNIAIMVNGRIYPRIKPANLKNMILFFLNPKTAYDSEYNIL